MSLSIIDWNDQFIEEGDTILYAAKEGRLTYALVTKIEFGRRSVRRSKYDTPNGRWQQGAKFIYWDEIIIVTKVRVKPLDSGPQRDGKSSHTIDERANYAAFTSITKFKAATDG